MQCNSSGHTVFGFVAAEFVEDFFLFLGIVREPYLVHALQVRHHLVIYLGLGVLFDQVLESLDTLTHLVHKDLAGGEVVCSHYVHRSNSLYLPEVLDGLIIVCVEDAHEPLVKQVHNY